MDELCKSVGCSFALLFVAFNLFVVGSTAGCTIPILCSLQPGPAFSCYYHGNLANKSDFIFCHHILTNYVVLFFAFSVNLCSTETDFVLT